jgi:outer membrane protein assembly factor BamB
VADVKAPLFAPPAVAGGVVYVADLAGVVHALDLRTGSPRWRFDLGSDPAVKSPGMIYGGVTVSGGKLIVATCNLDGPFARRPTCIVCLGLK